MTNLNRNTPSIGKWIVGFWTFFTTAATLVLGYAAYRDASALDRLDAREKLDKFMAAAREEYLQRCQESTQTLRPRWQSRFDALVDVANVDRHKAPYNAPCKKYERPSAPTLLGISFLEQKTGTNYKDWESFMQKEKKVSALWVGQVPILVDANNFDWDSAEKRYQEMIDAIKTCEDTEQSKEENTYIRVKCFYNINEINQVEMVATEESKK